MRPNATGVSPLYTSAPDKTFFLNPAAYSLQAVNTFGNAARNSAVGPGLTTTDWNLAKKFTRENWGVEFRVEMFNAFNHALLSQPTSAANSPLFGRIATTRGDNRQLQFGIKISR